ncbi:MAG: hypothetical protein EOL95_01790 [Bacteroidia bacterium]|nr:hypothetical protein [Bacteroidia bacterium]
MNKQTLLDDIRKRMILIQEQMKQLNYQIEQFSALSTEDDSLEKNNKVLAESVADKSNPIAEKTDNTIAQPQLKPVDARLIVDLQKAIGINDRFRFKNDLFKGDAKLMSDTFDFLNNVDAFEEAMSYVRSHFDWSETNDTVIYFFDLLHRRYYRS